VTGPDDPETTEDLPAVEVVEVETPDPAALGIDLPEDSEEAIDLLLRTLQERQDETTSLLDDLRRVAADFDNFRKRAVREQQQIVERAAERVVREMLPVLDSFDAALSIEAESETERKILGGMRGTREQLMEVLSREGLEEIPTWEEPFDPEIHEAVMSSGDGRLVVDQELRKGYRLRGKVLRAALVSVRSGE
jgi:molecular chaperone GrpE